MERIQESATATSVKLLKTTPDLLRQLATRLELQAKESTLPGEVVVYPLTRGLTIVYEPDISAQKWRRGGDPDASPHALVEVDPLLGHPDDLEGGP
jgi:hypothetical protein